MNQCLKFNRSHKKQHKSSTSNRNDKNIIRSSHTCTKRKQSDSSHFLIVAELHCGTVCNILEILPVLQSFKASIHFWLSRTFKSHFLYLLYQSPTPVWKESQLFQLSDLFFFYFIWFTKLGQENHGKKNWKNTPNQLVLCSIS